MDGAFYVIARKLANEGYRYVTIEWRFEIGQQCKVHIRMWAEIFLLQTGC